MKNNSDEVCIESIEDVDITEIDERTGIQSKYLFEESLVKEKQFTFASLSTDNAIKVSVNGDKFFNSILHL